jgi:hypothetical protein
MSLRPTSRWTPKTEDAAAQTEEIQEGPYPAQQLQLLKDAFVHAMRPSSDTPTPTFLEEHFPNLDHSLRSAVWEAASTVREELAKQKEEDWQTYLHQVKAAGDPAAALMEAMDDELPELIPIDCKLNLYDNGPIFPQN